MHKTVALIDGKWVYGKTDRAMTKNEIFTFTCNGRGRGGHYSVRVIIDKVNPKTFACTELDRSYAPGTKWRINKDDESIVQHLT